MKNKASPSELFSLRKARLTRRRRIRRRFQEARIARRKWIGVVRERKRPMTILAPRVFEVFNDSHRNAVVEFVHRIKNALALGRKVKLSFAETKLLSSGGTLLFIANIEKLIARFPGQISTSYPADEVVEQMFQHLGLLQKLGLTPRRSITAERVKYWHYIFGTDTALEPLEGLFNVLGDQLGDETAAGLFDSVSEAITNAVHHAYVDIPLDKLKEEPRWWLFAQLKDNVLEIAICDLGKGVPASIQEKPELLDLLPGLLRALRGKASSGLIEIAVESSRSRTKLPHRGKGLPDMLSFSKRERVGLFLIVSDNGVFLYSSQRQSEHAKDFVGGIGGTVIVWQIPILSH
jgi:hypothetical protein